ncbi:iron chaperone [Stigmatella aurantiaca]|uniref:Conserved uncharacterized protein n=2 Tax=Stigmatella aurantiaca (strain DW4/3-1) TaxID=378806 RepID=E3FQ53_STIAD|nr:DUF1801 domain-containing protein [Stigmatella aurantiaca]ADO68163.1 conserved uncharacterized protein [Stigmatella aurantiaca DW4/3-1]
MNEAERPGMAEQAKTVDAYIAAFPSDVQEILQRVRRAIGDAVPGGEEKIRYGMPAVMLGGRYALHFAGWKKHLGLYPVPALDDELEREIAPYRAAKDSVNFPYTKPIPYSLIERVARSLVARRQTAS